MFKSINDNLNTILYTNNWENILIRNAIRKDLLCYPPDERELFEYLKNASLVNLTEIRNRTFNLACDQRLENYLTNLEKPILRKTKNPKIDKNDVILKCALMKDIIEFLKCIFLGSKIPGHCLELNVDTMYSFPLGKRTLVSSLNSQGSIQKKSYEYESDVEYYKKYSDELCEMNLQLQASKQLLQKQVDENTLIHRFMTIFLLIFIVLLLFF